MTWAWALRLDPCDPARVASRLGALRLRPGLEACVDGQGATWVRGPAPLEGDPALAREVRASGGERFVVDPGGEVRAPGRRLPAGRLPAGPWTPLAAWLRPRAPAAAPAARPARRVALALVRAAADPGLPATALRADAPAFARWARGAPRMRLERLEVAARADRPEVIVRGDPLPPLPGERFVVGEGVAVPVGFVVAPALDAAALRGVLGLEEGDLALLSSAGVERVAARWFVPASRALARSLEVAP